MVQFGAIAKHSWRYDHLTWPEMRAAIARSPQPVVAIPIGAVEDHGPHMSISTDNDILEGILAACGEAAVVCTCPSRLSIIIA